MAVHFWETQLSSKAVGAAWLRRTHFYLPTSVSRSALKAGWAAQPTVAALPSSQQVTTCTPMKIIADKHLSLYPSQGNGDYLDVPNPKQLSPPGRAAVFPSIY